MRRATGQRAADVVDTGGIGAGDDQGSPPAVARDAGKTTVGQFRGDEAIALARPQCLHHRMLGRVSLDQRLTRPVLATRAAGYLIEQLEGALGGTQIAAV